jgi:hypothetical protein
VDVSPYPDGRDGSAYGLRGFPCNETSYQTWFRTDHNGYYVLRNAATGWCLDDSTSSLSHEAYNDVLRAIPCNGLPYQDWREIWPWTGTKEWMNVATGRCLDDSTAYGNDVLRAYACLGNNYQAWIPY